MYFDRNETEKNPGQQHQNNNKQPPSSTTTLINPALKTIKQVHIT